MRVLNTKLLSHPLNWLVVWSMLLIVAYLGHLMIAFFSGQHPGAVAVNNATEDVAGPGTDTVPGAA